MYLMPTTIKGQITLPKEYRDILNFKSKEVLSVRQVNGGIFITKLPSISALKGALKTNKAPLTPSQMREIYQDELVKQYAPKD